MDRILTGQTEIHLADWQGARVHKGMIESLDGLWAAAKEAGFTLAIASSFRGFDAQLRIWNEKATGKRPVLDDDGKAVPIECLSPHEGIQAILRWSALPGASRHHWGTDIDVFDKGAVPADYRVVLTPEESNGVFGRFHHWLDQHLPDFDFFRPYAKDQGGVSPERWHLSYAPQAQAYFKLHTPDLLRTVLSKVEMVHRETVLAELDVLFAQFVSNITLP